ncbi:PIR Superfamily Protein [Plasmodium ovale wallikeri]|uniref:PIR Superfamily Protein n=1 Tax=Plasmodium ovale wallikeri TaxID=864142 RepID=A0A1A9AJZ2_PLAOA|nr:PIR Superfamily Protein [Plasmodium ovale wallikeri]SBT58029.1 PIR Superfamily Protein [Plasmodium ovale wallikeri]
MTNVSKCTYCSLCDNKPSNYDDDHPLKIFCYFFVRNLGILQDRKSEDNYKKNMYCDHLIQWMYNKYYNLEKGNTYRDFYDFLGKLNTVRNTFFSGDITGNDFCNDVISKKFTFNDINKRKKFHDYYVNFKYIEDMLKTKNDKCHKYYSYIKGMTTLYSDMVEKCPKPDNKKYCENVNYEECNPKNLLQLEKCKEIQDAQDKESNEGESTEQMFIWEHCNNKVINLSDYRAILIIGLAVWGIMLTVLFLCKNTSVGLLIRNFLRKKEIIRNNFSGDIENDILSENSDNFHENLETGRYSVGYYPG